MKGESHPTYLRLLNPLELRNPHRRRPAQATPLLRTSPARMPLEGGRKTGDAARAAAAEALPHAAFRR